MSDPHQTDPAPIGGGPDRVDAETGLPLAWEDQQTTARSREWSETYQFDLCSDDGEVGVWVAITRWPAQGRVSYWSGLVRRGHPVVVILEDEVPIPRSGTLEYRTSGLWADHICESRYRHWTAGLEAFGLAFDDPLEIFGRMFGIRTPVAYDLEWEDEPATARRSTGLGFEGYGLAGRAHGEVLVGDAELELDGIGYRSHRWGVAGWGGLAPEGWAASADGTAAVGPVDIGPVGVDRLPVAGGCELGNTGWRVDVALGWTPVPIHLAEGHLRRMARTPVTYRNGQGATALGWVTAFGAL